MTDLSFWRACAPPQLPSVTGRFIRIEPFDAEAHGAGLFAAIGGGANDDLWRYIPFPAPESTEQMSAILTLMAQSPQQEWRTHILVEPQTNEVLGMASYMRIRPEHGSAEIGCIVFSKKLQRTPAATEAMYLMAKHLFDDLGYRRYEWKCNNENAASKGAAERLGFSFEGIFRNDMVVKGQNRDTAWYSIIDLEWPNVKAAFEAWLVPENFDDDGGQHCALASCRNSAIDI